MATITYDAEGPGKGAMRPAFWNAPRSIKVVSGRFSFDSSYPTGGEDVSEIFALFAGSVAQGFVCESPVFSAGTGKHSRIDYTNKKWMLYTNAADPAEVANASDQSGAASLRFLAWGYQGPAA